MATLDECVLLDDGEAVALRWADGRRARYHAIWLRDNAQDSGTRDPGNGQRLLTLAEIDPATRMAAADILDGALHVHFGPEDRVISFDPEWLWRHRYDRERPARPPAWVAPGRRLWGAHSAAVHRAPLRALERDRARLADWLSAVQREGYALVTDGPIESGALARVVALFGHLRETNYGRWFEVRTELDPSNLAYTGRALQLHTDNPYRDPVPGLQLLYCLRDAAAGGETILVDGFAAVEQLRERDPQALALLSEHCARFEFAGTAGVCLRARRPMIELGAGGELLAVRFNNRSTAPIIDVPYAQLLDYYAAYRRFAETLDDPALALQFKLQPGEAVLFDNTRILHARSGFSGAGGRLLQGCYADMDGLLSSWRALSAECGGEQVASSAVGQTP